MTDELAVMQFAVTTQSLAGFDRFYEISRCTGIPYAGVNATLIAGAASVPVNGRPAYLNLCLGLPPLGSICMPAVPPAFVSSAEQVAADAAVSCGVYCA